MLPFIPQPYPDEILGSWLYRLRLHNHPTSFNAFTKQFMTNNIVEAGWRDISAFNPFLDKFLNALDSSYSESLLKLTTYPYWLRCHSAKDYASENFLVQITPVPELLLNRRKKTPTRFSYLRSGVIRICPDCLTEDLERYGEPYLHRAHHLPFTNICHQHQIELISKCRNCEVVFLADKTFTNAKLKCTCNVDLRQFKTKKLAHAESWARLAKYSAEALMSKANIYACTDYFKFFDSCLHQLKIKNRNDLLDFLAKSFGPENARALLTLSPQRSDEYEYSAIGSVSRIELRAPQICAFFAAQDISFEQTHTLFKQYLDGDKAIHYRKNMGTKSSSNKVPSSIEEARAYVYQLENSLSGIPIRSYLYARRKSLFWYLTLLDRQWFENRYPNGGRGATKHIPSIQEDRESILSAIQKASRLRITIWKNLAQQAYFRASLRDVTWLEIKKRASIGEAKSKLLKQKLAHLEMIEQELKKALTMYLSSSAKHVRMSIKSIAPYTTFNVRQLRYLVFKNPVLKKYVSETNADFDLRTQTLSVSKTTSY